MYFGNLQLKMFTKFCAWLNTCLEKNILGIAQMSVSGGRGHSFRLFVYVRPKVSITYVGSIGLPHKMRKIIYTINIAERPWLLTRLQCCSRTNTKNTCHRQ